LPLAVEDEERLKPQRRMSPRSQQRKVEDLESRVACLEAELARLSYQLELEGEDDDDSEQ